jgi:hypothetical protein
MDRHDGGDLSPEAVVEAHAADLKIQDKYDCKFITYWYDCCQSAKVGRIGTRENYCYGEPALNSLTVLL